MPIGEMSWRLDLNLARALLLLSLGEEKTFG